MDRKKFKVYKTEKYIECLKLETRAYQARAGLHAHNYRCSQHKNTKAAKEAAKWHNKAFERLSKLLTVQKELENYNASVHSA